MIHVHFLKHSASTIRWILLLMMLSSSALAAPFAKKFPFVQPDGTTIELWGEGDEFHAVFETLDGYTVVFDPAVKTYFYATRSADGSTLEATSVQAGKGKPAQLGIPKHARINAAAKKEKAAERFKKWDKEMGISKRWSDLKSARRTANQAGEQGMLLTRSTNQSDATGIQMAPPSFTTTGTKVGLCLLIDFDDDPATIPQAEIVNFCNGDNYTGYGNNGSVKKYFLDNSDNRLTYSNVVTVYIRIPNTLHPKSWYNDTSKDCGTQGNLLIRDAISILTNLPNYTTTILPEFNSLTVDGANQVLACNVFYAGGNGGAWSYGLWPHSWALYNVGEQSLSPGGKKVFRYQITDIGSTLELGTFCHENGHMLCGFPDIYDYGYDSIGGAGMFCLMNSGGHGANPVQICAYLKRAAGWATVQELTSTSFLTASLNASTNVYYRYAKPGVSTEYFLFENRQKTGRDANLPASGVAIWHVDELGDKDNQSLVTNSTHANYEVTLVQADNLWHFQNDVNSGDSKDLYYLGNTAAGYSNTFSDDTAPNARWWDGSSSLLRIKNFSTSGTIMTFAVGEAFTVSPTDGLSAAGPAGGPFSPLSSSYTIRNTGTNSVSWTAAKTANWLDLSLSTGTLLSGESNLLVISINTNIANQLAIGTYTDTVTISNSISSSNQTRLIRLTVQEDFTYITNNGSITITGYLGTGGTVTIPNTLNGLPVNRIGDSAFANRTNLTGIIIPDSVTHIGYKAFNGAGLTNIVVPASVTNYANDGSGYGYAFGYNPLRTATVLGTIIGNNMFQGCSQLVHVVLNTNSTTIPVGTFLYCSALKTLQIPDTVTSIRSLAFAYTGITNHYIPSAVTNISVSAFDYCPNLQRVYFRGNAPTYTSPLFQSSTNATVYRILEAAGWPTVPNPWAGRPTALWTYGNYLTVIGGTGSGSYSNGAQIAIVATNTSLFDQWTGDTQYVASALSPATTVTMPGQNIQLTATYFRSVQYFTWDSIVSTQTVGSPISVSIEARDSDGALVTRFTNTVTINCLAPGIGTVFQDTVENGTNGWIHSGSYDLWHISTNRSSSTNRSWYCGNGQTRQYVNWMDCSLISPSILISTGAKLSFQHWYSTELGYDYAYVDISTNNGSTYTTLATFHGNGASWRGQTNDLSSYAGHQAKLRFRFTSDDSVIQEGWYLDDIRIVNTNPTAITMTPTHSGNFIGGVWNGQVTVLNPATNVTLHADDGNGHSGTSGVFHVQTIADIGISMSAAPEPVLTGSNLTYSIIVSNNGPTTASSILASNRLPVSVMFISASTAQGTITNANGTVTWNVGTVSNGFSTTATVVVKPTVAGSITNTITLASATIDPNANNNTASTITDVQGYMLIVSNGTGSGTYSNGQLVTISANASTGGLFYRWIGDTQFIDNATLSTATVTMPAQNISLTATYTYSLTVNNGSGSGSYTNNARVAVSADPVAGYIFSKWTTVPTNYSSSLANASAASTTFTMPPTNVTLTATYQSAFTHTTNNGEITITGYLGSGGNETIPSSINGFPVTRIGSSAFANRTNLTGIIIPNSVTQLGYKAFDRSGLTNIVVPASVTNYVNDGSGYGYAFGYNPLRTATVLGTIIGNNMFQGCSQLVHVVLNTNSTTIPVGTFLYCSALKTVQIPDTVTSIGTLAFAYTGITNHYIPSAVTNISVSTFDYCPNLQRVYFRGNAPTYTSPLFQSSTNVTVYRASVATGWPAVPDPWAGRPTALWQLFIDDDIDEIPDSWELEHFGNLNITPSTICSNGIHTVRQAYIAGLNPNDPQSKFRPALTSPTLTNTLIQWSGVSGRVYSVYFSTNLLNGFQPLASNLHWSVGSYTDSVHNALSDLFYRVEVKLEQ